MRTPTSVRNFDSSFRELADRGHEVHAVFERLKKNSADQTAQIDALCAESPLVTQGQSPLPAKYDRWYRQAAALRFAMDYLRYLSPAFADAPQLRRRGAERAPSWVLLLGRLGIARAPWALGRVMAGLRRIERSLPQDEKFDEYLRAERPDVLLVSPLVHVGPQGQVELLRAARRLGIPTGLLVHSWDNLTTKGLIHEVPDRVAVWNYDQVAEAVEMHGVPPERMAVTGAPTYDQWFGWASSTTHAEFCEHVGLDPGKPYILYLGSSYFIAPKEGDHVETWLTRLRAHPELRDVGVLIRPHPVAAKHWIDFDEHRWDNVCIYPRAGADPINSRTKADYFDSIHHSSAVVGVNTSALIETAIVGRAVHSLSVPRYRNTQQGTLHFRYLSRDKGGPLVVTATFEKHLEGLAAAVRGDAGDDEAARAFVHRFVRPLGPDVRATAALADVIEALGRDPRVPSAPVRPLVGLRLTAVSAAISLLDLRQRVRRRS